MISKSDKRTLLKTFKSKHINKIAKWCEDNGIRKQDGSLFSNSMISMVFNGATSKTEHPILEKAIFNAANYYLSEQKKTEDNREKLINKLKSHI